jgi:hypothetical protein
MGPSSRQAPSSPSRTGRPFCVRHCPSTKPKTLIAAITKPSVGGFRQLAGQRSGGAGDPAGRAPAVGGGSVYTRIVFSIACICCVTLTRSAGSVLGYIARHSAAQLAAPCGSNFRYGQQQNVETSNDDGSSQTPDAVPRGEI